jgi:hypothetical protein
MHRPKLTGGEPDTAAAYERQIASINWSLAGPGACPNAVELATRQRTAAPIQALRWSICARVPASINIEFSPGQGRQPPAFPHLIAPQPSHVEPIRVAVDQAVWRHDGIASKHIDRKRSGCAGVQERSARLACLGRSLKSRSSTRCWQKASRRRTAGPVARSDPKETAAIPPTLLRMPAVASEGRTRVRLWGWRAALKTHHFLLI